MVNVNIVSCRVVGLIGTLEAKPIMDSKEQEQRFSTLSKRSQRIPIDLNYVEKYSSWPAIQNPFHETENPEGIINFGTAVSGLMDDIWIDRLNSNSVYKPSYKHFRYYQFWGHDDLRKKLSHFMTHFFQLQTEIKFENLFVSNGAMVSLDILAFLLADEKDVFLCPVPGYNSYFQAGKQRWNIEIISVPFDFEIKKMEATFHFKLETLERVFAEQKALGKNVRAFILNNPNNPLGIVLERETVEKIMKFCQREKIHLIADEMYCMSIFDKSTPFHSALQIRNDKLLDPDLLHVIWGFSKDLCLTAYRTGVIHTENRELQLKLMAGSQYQAVPLPVMDMLSNIISDIDWFQNDFVPTNMERLKISYEIASNALTTLGIPTTRTKAGFFFLANFSSFLKPCNVETCKAFVQKLYQNRVYITPGWDMRAEPGWFRIVFTSYLGNGLNEGLRRLKNAVEQWKQENP